MSGYTEEAVAFFYRSHFGFAAPPSKTQPGAAETVAKALFTAIAGDGKVTPAERTWVKGYFAAKGYPTEVIAAVDTMEPTPIAQLTEQLQMGVLKFGGARIVIYDAIRASRADGEYADGERAAIRTIAKSLDVAESAVAEIEQLVDDEEQMLQRRIALLVPGNPSLDERYRTPR